MSEVKYTPGPWIVDPCEPYVVIPAAVETEKGGYIAEVAGDDFEQQEANARLIAAAPELLEALEGMFNGTCYCDFAKGGYTHHGRHCEAARAAIAKAKGTL